MPADTPFPDITGWEVTAGRWRYDSVTGWVQGAGNQPRTYSADGVQLGYLMEGAETFYSAPWHDSAAAHGTGDAAYLAKTGTGDGIAYAGGHSQPDIHGGTGKGVEITQGAVANSVFTANNVVCATTGTSDLLRVEVLFSIPVTTGVGGTIAVRTAARSGTAPSNQLILNYDAAGNITGWNTVIDPNTYRVGYGEGTPRSNGEKTWFVWVERRATGVGTVAPAIGLPAAVAGRKVVIHDMRILLNPQTAPKAVPVLAAAKTFAADTMVTDVTGTKGALFHRLGRCRTRITDGRFAVSTFWARSGPYIPYENFLQIVPSSETADVPSILPNEYEEVDFTPWQTPANFTLALGPGYYNHRFVLAFSKAAVNASVTSAFKNDPALMAQLERVVTHPSYVTGALTIDDIIVFSRASEVTTQFEQTDLSTDVAGTLNVFRAGTNLSVQRSLVVAHPSTHSRARAEAQNDDSDDQRAWIGVNTFLSNTSGSAVTLSDSHFWRMGRPCYITMGDSAKVMNLTADGVYFDQIWSDCFLLVNATLNMNFDRVLFGRMTAAVSDLWQSRKEIEVNTGSGWVNLSASGLTVANLPVGRKATKAGTWNFAGSSFTPAPDPSRYLHVRSWDIGSSSGIHNKVGYQWHASLIHYENEDRVATTGDVFVIEQGDAPTPATPWIRLTFDLGFWPNTSTYTTGTNPALMMTGTHADFLQVNRTGAMINSMTADGVVIMGRGQGMFMTGMPDMGATGSDIKSATFDNWIVISDQSWSFEFDYSKTPGSLCSVSNTLTLPMTSRYRYNTGTVPTLGIGARGPNNTINLNNVHVGHRTGTMAALAIEGGSITGSYSQVKIGEIGSYAVTAPSGTPKITDMLDSQWLDPFTYAVRADINPLDPGFGFTEYAETTTGIALNSILEDARGNHARWDAVKALIAGYHRNPDHVVSVPAATAVGASVLTGLTATGWKRLYSGNEKGYFGLDAGALKVAKPLTGINQCWLLETDKGELILVDIQ